MLSLIAYVEICPIWREQIWLEGFLGFETRVVKLC